MESHLSVFLLIFNVAFHGLFSYLGLHVRLKKKIINNTANSFHDSIVVDTQEEMITEMVAVRMGILVDCLGHMVSAGVGVVVAVVLTVVVEEITIDRMKTVVLRSGAPKMVKTDGVTFLVPKFRTHLVGKLSQVDGVAVEVVVVVVGVGILQQMVAAVDGEAMEALVVVVVVVVEAVAGALVVVEAVEEAVVAGPLVMVLAAAALVLVAGVQVLVQMPVQVGGVAAKRVICIPKVVMLDGQGAVAVDGEVFL